ncbi:hypothetical protein BDV40DRAFT_297552 [Aspergillus tamarii]|uniref:Uncharacterized protein n=1 Tax=Aspergillus tamarii TaxID=41984 RepID=A0A5N6V3G7_ASPTM|nr:hypothetical protein BDV40DRAFT_297552 [Aspergillus tamarii]
MSTVFITFDGPDGFEEQNDTVIKLLEEIGLQEGEYPEITNRFPPVKIIPENVKKLDGDFLNRLRELDGVIVNVEGEDD